MTGVLANWLNVRTAESQRLAIAYVRGGWPTLKAALVPLEQSQGALWEADWFQQHGWRVDVCDDDVPHGGFPLHHYYVRHHVGRRPLACPVRMSAARKRRARQSEKSSPSLSLRRAREAANTDAR